MPYLKMPYLKVPYLKMPHLKVPNLKVQVCPYLLPEGWAAMALRSSAGPDRWSDEDAARR